MGWICMKISQAVKESIESRFGEGQIFTILDFSELDKTYRRGHIRSTLSMLSNAKCGYLLIVGKVKGTGNMPPVNQYRLAKPINKAEIEEKIPSGTTTVWQTKPPVNKCNRVQFYEVLDYSDEINCYKWNGSWPIPSPWVKGWRGVTR